MQTTLLYVRSPRRPLAVDAYEASALDASQIPYDECENIYRAMARLCRSDGAAIETVVVALDGLLSDEFEFFSLARRSRPDVTIYVHARLDAQGQIALAIGRGAAGQLTEDVVLRLREGHEASDAPLSDHPHDDDPSRHEQPPAVHAHDIESIEAEGAFQDEPTLGLAGDADIVEETPLDTADQECSEPARVPWSSRQNAPKRVRPSAESWTRDTPSKPGARAGANAADPDALSEPLLTQEELAALISEEPDLPPPTDHDQPSDSEAPS